MKKLLLAITIIVNIQLLNANPLPPPAPVIVLSEFRFETDGKWVLELYNRNDYGSSMTDSVFVITSSGRAKLKSFIPQGYENRRFIIVRNEDMLSDLSVNTNEDSIKVEYHYIDYNEWGNDARKTRYTNTIKFGKTDKGYMPAPKTGESVAEYNGEYGLDKSPTINAQNDTVGMVMGTMRGSLYDEENNLLKSYPYEFYGNGFAAFRTDENGTFSTRVLLNNYNITSICYDDDGDYNQNYKLAEINPVNVKFSPDTVINADIHIIKRTAMGLNEINSGNISVLNVFPNPLKDKSFNYETTIPVKSTNSYLEIADINGKKIARYPVEEQKGYIKLPLSITKGTYVVKLMVNSKNYGSTKVLVEE